MLLRVAARAAPDGSTGRALSETRVAAAGLSLEPHPGFMADGVKTKQRAPSCMLSETNVVTVLGRRDPFAAAAARRSDSDGREFGDPCRWR